MTDILYILHTFLISSVLAGTSYEPCYRTKLGRGYNGKINVTLSGKTCQKWGLLTPHNHNYTWLWTEENYCRNPDDKETGPWCFTMDPTTVLESCGIPQCTLKFDVCLTKPCQNGGTCKSHNVLVHPYYKCVCDSMWTGLNCEIKVPQCQFKPCKNGGSCMEIKENFMCHCPRNYVGKTCEIKTDRCEEGWKRIGIFCYKVPDRSMNWLNAQRWCVEQYHATLPAIDSPQMQSSMSRLATEEKSDLWMGIKYINGTWAYMNYSTSTLPIKTFYWHRLYKNSRFKNDSCILLKQADNRTASAQDNWIPLSCALEKKFVCQKMLGICSVGWFHHQHKCYKILDDLQTSIWNARDQCSKLDSNLLEIHSGAEEIFLQDFLQLQRTGIGNDGKFWLNLQRNSDSMEKQWVWRGNPSEDLKILKNKFPTSASNEGECAYLDIDTIFKDKKGMWRADAFCSESFSVVCTHELDSEGWIKNLERKLRLDSNRGPSECGIGWADDEESSCFYLVGELLTWQSAENRCRQMGAHLISIDDAAEQKFITDLIKPKVLWGSVWIGANSRTEEMGFQWTDGGPFAYYNWFPGDPESQLEGDEECVAMFISNSLWTDNSCQQLHSAVCEKTRPSHAKNRTSMEIGNIRSQTTSKWMEIYESDVPGACVDGWIPHRESCFLIQQRRTTWDEARDLCRQQNSHLASIVDIDERYMVFSQLPQGISAMDYGNWIGLRDKEQQTFRWEDNKDVTYTAWQKNEPQGFTPYKEGCTFMNFKNGLWGDTNCNSFMPGYVCRSSKQLNLRMTVSPISIGCEQTFVGLNSFCYRISKRKYTWKDAESKCQAYGGHLATINSMRVLYFLVSQLNKGNPAWIGYSVSDNKSSWTSGKTVLMKQPLVDIGGNLTEKCGFLYTSLVGVSDCMSKENFICEKHRTGYKALPSSTASIPTTLTLQTCPPGWHKYGNRCFKGILDKLSWSGARRKCRNIGARLIIIDNGTTFSFVYNRFNRVFGEHWWIGLNNRAMSNRTICLQDLNHCMVWSDSDENPSFRRWGYDQPHYVSGSGSCVIMSARDGKFKVSLCNLMHPFICEAGLGSPLLQNDMPSNFTHENCKETGYNLYKNFCYLFNDTETSYANADKYCKHQGAELASIHTTNELGFILSLQTNHGTDKNYWIGIKRVTYRGLQRYEWTDKSPINFAPWKSFISIYSPYKTDCVAMSANGEKWNLHRCSEEKGFFCKKRNIARHSKKPSIKNSFAGIDGGCASNYTASPFNNKCYLYMAKPTTWKLANRSCHALGGSLLTIENELEQDFIVSFMDAASDDVWTSVRIARHKEFMDGGPIRYSNWMKDQPKFYSTYTPFYCATMNHRNDNSGIGRWRSISCSFKKPFICEKPKDPSIAKKEISNGCPAGYEEYKRRCIKLGVGPTNRDTAQSICRQSKGNLASITSVYEYGVLRGIAAKNITTYWIGLRRTNTSVMYRWDDGIPYQFSHWKDSEPSQTPGEECVVSEYGNWMDVPCTGNYSYLCEINPDKVVSEHPLPSCMPHGLAFNGACYYIERKDKSTWKDALLKCRKYGMELTDIHSVTELEVLREYIVRRKEERVWIGMTNSRKESDLFKSVYWYWTNGEKVTFTNWAINKPSTGILQNMYECVEMYGNGFWSDGSCTSKRSFICKHNVSAVEPKDVSTMTTIGIKPKFVPHPHTILTNVSGATRKKESLKQTEGSSTHVGLIVGITVAVLVSILIALVIGLLIYRRRHQPLFQPSIGFANAMFQKENEESNG